MNILWILTTQWRADACGYAGNHDVNTPALDALERESINYAQAVTPHPFGPFARAALLTGVPSLANGVRDYFDPLPISAQTIAHAMSARGYSTAFFGKWHLAPRDPDAPLVGEAHAKTIVPPERRGGFQFWEGFESGFQLNDPWLHGTRLESPTKRVGYQSDVLCDSAAEWIKGNSAPLWFCLVSLEPPHPPYHSAPGSNAYQPDELALPINVPRGGAVESRVRRDLAGYYAHISATDRAIGRLLACTDKANTCVMVTSVHGDMHGAHGLFRKGWPHEESVRVPLLFRVPGERPRRESAPISLVDLPAITLGLATQTPVQPKPPFAQISMPSVVRLPDQCDRVWRGVRSPTRKLILNEDGSPWLFFDLENDPFELTNCVGDPHFRDEIEHWRSNVCE